MVTSAVISVSVCGGEYHVSSIEKHFPQIDNNNLISSWVYENSLVLYLHQYCLILSMMVFYISLMSKDVESFVINEHLALFWINWQFEALKFAFLLWFLASKIKKKNPKGQIEYDFRGKKIVLLLIIKNFYFYFFFPCVCIVGFFSVLY